MNDSRQLGELMTIGAFARRTRLSYKALRLYGSIGLLSPTYVDEETSYRYYSEEQIERAKLIGLLRRLEMPLTQIGLVLNLEGPAAARAVAGYWREVEADARSKRHLVRYLENYLEGTGEYMSKYEIKRRQVAQQKVATIEGRIYANDLPKFIGDSMGRIYSYILDSGSEPAGVPFVAYHGQIDLDSDGPVETCVPFTGQLEPKDDIRIRIEPAHVEAYTTIKKSQVSFPQILEAYDAVSQHLQQQGFSAGAPREVYFADWDEISDEDPACDIAFPLL